jgi:hypothetical protein
MFGIPTVDVGQSFNASSQPFPHIVLTFNISLLAWLEYSSVPRPTSTAGRYFGRRSATLVNLVDRTGAKL